MRHLRLISLFLMLNVFHLLLFTISFFAYYLKVNEEIKPIEEHSSTVNQNNDSPSHTNSEDNVKHASDKICEGQTPTQISQEADQSEQLPGDRKNSVISNSINASTNCRESRGKRTYTRLTQLHCDVIGKYFWLEHPYILGKAKR